MFGNNTDSSQATSLATNARGNSVTAERLTKTSGGFLQKDFLPTAGVIAHLNPDEQPQYFLFNDNKGIARSGSTTGGGADTSYRSLCVITDKRLLFFTAGSKGEAFSLGAITSVETNTGHMKHRLTFTTESYEYTFYASNTIDGDEVEACGEYIETRSQEVSEIGDSSDVKLIDGFDKIWDSQLSKTPSATDALAADPQGGYVTKGRYNKIKDMLEGDEKVHFLTRGSTVDVEGSSAGRSLFGDDRSRKSGTRGWVRAIITNKRVAIKIPQVLGNDERSIPYSSITSVDLDTGLVNKRLTLQTPGQTYHIEVHDPGKEEVRQAIRFIRMKVEEANQSTIIQQESKNTESDPLERIEKLKKLNDSGVVSDEEFEEKKQELLDKV